MNEIGFYPPRNIQGFLVEKLSDLPTSAKIEDMNEYYRLYVDNTNKNYIYKIKNPQSPLFKLLNEINEREPKNNTVNKNI